jgi:hypothetical protein
MKSDRRPALSRREEFLDGNLQNLGQEHEVFVVYKRSRASIFEIPLRLMSKPAIWSLVASMD